MKKIFNIFVLSVITSILVLFSSCSFGKAPPISDTQIKTDIIACLEKDNLKVSDIPEVTTTYSELTEENIKILKDKFSSSLPARAVEVSFKATAVAQNISGKYFVLYAYYNKAWIIVENKKTDIDHWVFTAKEKVSNKIIAESIKGLTFDGFSRGDIGNEKDTIIELGVRKTDLDSLSDIINVNIIYDSTFAKYKINVKLTYSFELGSWILKEGKIDDKSLWDISYNQNLLPAEPQNDLIVNALSNSSLYDTYMMNMENVSDYYLIKGENTISAKDFAYNYTLVVRYNDFGEFKYKISQPFTWGTDSWTNNGITCTFDGVDLNPMVGTWACQNGSFLTIKSVDKTNINGFYTHKYADGSYVTYQITGTLDTKGSADFYNLNVTQGKVYQGTELEKITIMPFKLNLKTKTIINNGNEFVIQADEDAGSGWIINGNPSDNNPNPSNSSENTTSVTSSGLTFF